MTTVSRWSSYNVHFLIIYMNLSVYWCDEHYDMHSNYVLIMVVGTDATPLQNLPYMFNWVVFWCLKVIAYDLHFHTSPDHIYP